MDLSASSSSSSSDDEFVFMLFNEERKRKRRYWVHPILEEREEHGDFRRLIKELKLYHDRFHRYFRVSVSQFESLLNLVAPSLSKSRTNFRKPIDPEQRLAVCLRFLATGDSYRTIASNLSLGISTVARVVAETCEAIWNCLKEEYMPVPTHEVWKNTAKRFQERWNLHNCLGALDGKRISVQAPGNSASLHFEYKGSFSVVLLVLIDADYRFLVVDVGSYGGGSDVGIFSNSALGKALRDGTLNIPAPAELPGAPELGKVNHVLVANETFPLKPYLLRPYPERHLLPDMKIYNCRLSRARQISENCFNKLCQRFRFFQRRLQVSPAVADSVIKAACILCNYLWPSDQNSQDEFLEDDSSGCTASMEALGQMGGNRASSEAQNVRDTYKKYFNSPAGQVDWQYEHVPNGLGGK